MPTDPRDLADTQVGTTLRDGAVDPRASDFLPPTNAGEAGEAGNPHGPNVVAPEIHASGSYVVVPGDTLPISDQELKETEFAQRVLVDGETPQAVSADLADGPTP